MKHRALVLLYSLVALALSPLAALGQDDSPRVDAKLEGLARNATIEDSSTALTWMLFVLLALICVSVLFKNAKRTHLD